MNMHPFGNLTERRKLFFSLFSFAKVAVADSLDIAIKAKGKKSYLLLSEDNRSYNSIT